MLICKLIVLALVPFFTLNFLEFKERMKIVGIWKYLSEMYDAMIAKFKMQYFCTCLLDDILSLQIINELANYVNKEAFYYI